MKAARLRTDGPSPCPTTNSGSFLAALAFGEGVAIASTLILGMDLGADAPLSPLRRLNVGLLTEVSGTQSCPDIYSCCCGPFFRQMCQGEFGIAEAATVGLAGRKCSDWRVYFLYWLYAADW